MTTNATDFYTELWDMRDKRVEDWPLMSSPWPTVSICVGYLYFSKVLGPMLMKDRKPFDLKAPIMAYNVWLVVWSAYMVYEAWMAGWGTTYSWVCQNVEKSSNPDSNAMRMARVSWVYFISKFVEFLDTIFFIGAKKFRNVSALQVIHHSLMPLFTFAICRWLPGGQETFIIVINCTVHVCMYFYYFMASLGPQFQKYLWWKRYLTSFQIIQLTMVLVKSMVVITGVAKCGYPWQFSVVSAVLMVIFLYLFFDFYFQEYSKDKKPRTNGTAEGVKTE